MPPPDPRPVALPSRFLPAFAWILAVGCGSAQVPSPRPVRPPVATTEPGETITVDRTARPIRRDPPPPRRAASEFKLMTSPGFTTHPCSEEPRLRSEEASTSRILEIVNRTHVRISAYWLDYAGQRVHYADLKPSEGYDQQTYLTHPWVIVDDQSRCIGIFVPKFPAFPGDPSVIAAVPG